MGENGAQNLKRSSGRVTFWVWGVRAARVGGAGSIEKKCSLRLGPLVCDACCVWGEGVGGEGRCEIP